MADTWYVRRSGGAVVGPFNSQQLRQMALEGRIDEHTPVGKGRDGPFASAGQVRGLIPHHGVPFDPGDTDKRLESLPPGAYVEDSDPDGITSKIRPLPASPAGPPTVAPDRPLLALWTMAVSAGMAVGLLLYGVAWKFTGPVWGYGIALVPLAVALFLAGGYPYLTHKTRLNRVSAYVNGAFLALTLAAAVGTVYDLWTLDARAKAQRDELIKSVDRTAGRPPKD